MKRDGTRRRRPRRFPGLRVYLAVLVAVIILLTLILAWTATTLIGLFFSDYSASTSGPSRLPRRPTLAPIHAIATEETLWSFGSCASSKSASSFCASWSVNVDKWWASNPAWGIALQNISNQCFAPLQNVRQADLYTRLHHIQFPAGSCDEQSVITKHMTGSGWGVDMSHVVDGLLQAMEKETPVYVVAPTPWQYASGVHGSAAHPACRTADLACYFLPLTNCSSSAQQQQEIMGKPEIRYAYPWRGFVPRGDDVADSYLMPWLLQYATRPQTWLREAAVKVAATVQLPPQPCTVMHVRRADVVLHGKFSRRYHAIAEYLQALEDARRQTAGKLTTKKQNILLLTDDANAIREAIQKHSESYYSWFYLDRHRHQGASGGWENQIPSDDPTKEVVMLHAAFQLAETCQTLVHSKSNLADYLWAIMLLRNPSAVRIDLDARRPHEKIHRESNAESVRISEAYN